MTSTSLNSFKKNFLNIFISGALLTFSLFFFLYFVRVKFKSYLNQIAQFTAQSQVIQQGLSAGTLTPYDTKAFLDKFGSLTSNALLFGYVVVPIVLFLLIVIFESIIFKLIRDGNLEDYPSYFKKFFLLLLTASIAGAALIYPVLSNIQTMLFGFSPILFLLMIMGVLLFYFTLITCCRISHENVLRTFRTSMILGYKKFWKLFPLNLAMMILTGAMLFFFSILFTAFTLKTIIWFSITTDVFIMIALLIAILFMQNLFYFAVNKYSS